ncbi:MAG TPA: diguanylate cyclase [Rhodocyclaceae bacterium]
MNTPPIAAAEHPSAMALRLHPDDCPGMHWLAGIDAQRHWFNGSWLAFTGRPLEQELGMRWMENIHPDDQARCQDAAQRHYSARERYSLEYRLRYHDGEYRWILESGAPRQDGGGCFVGYQGICFDIHDRKQLEEALRQQVEFTNAILDCGPEGVKVMAPDGQLLMLNRAGLQMLEVPSLKEAQKRGLAYFVLPEHQAAFARLHKRVMSGKRGKLEYEVMGKKGTRRWLEIHATPLRGSDGQISGVIGVSHDVTARRALLSKLEYQAHTDSLTGLPNRSYFFELAERELSRSARYGSALSLLMLDVDRFKAINDTYGHKAGDLVLAAVAQAMRTALRGVDVLGRIGGEEFAVVLTETGRDAAADAAQRLCEAVFATQTCLPDGRLVSATVSIGVAPLVSRGTSLDSLIQHADQAMYAAKRAGRNRAVAYA